MVSFEAYKFDHVYEFADIIYKMVEDETMFWAYDNTQRWYCCRHSKVMC